MPTSTIPVTYSREAMKSIRFEGLKFFVEYENGEVHEYKYEYVGRGK